MSKLIVNCLWWHPVVFASIDSTNLLLQTTWWSFRHCAHLRSNTGWFYCWGGNRREFLSPRAEAYGRRPAKDVPCRQARLDTAHLHANQSNSFLHVTDTSQGKPDLPGCMSYNTCAFSKTCFWAQQSVSEFAACILCISQPKAQIMQYLYSIRLARLLLD